MATLKVYPETPQFHQVVSHVTRRIFSTSNDRVKQSSTLQFIGTVKLHGSNAAIVYEQNIGHWCQSRNRVLSFNYDNAGFMQHIDPLARQFYTEHVRHHCSTIREYYERGSTVVIFGEWCGDNIQGQSNVAITGLPKMFVIFKIKIINRIKALKKSADAGAAEKYKDDPDGFWLDPQEWVNVKWHEHSIYNIFDFPSYEIDINFTAPHLSQDKLTQITEEVERRCPVGTYFQRTGGGEGIVWTEWKQTHGSLTFKVKGRQYMITNSTTLVPVQIPKVNDLKEFVEYACTKNRMQQAYNCIQQELTTVEAKDVTTFVRWLAEDIIKEEKDTMDAAHINTKDITRAITSMAQTWFHDRLTDDRKVKTRKRKTSK